MRNQTTKNQKSFTQPHFCIRKSGAGFTLIEMMVAVAIFSLMVGTIINIFMWGIREQRRALATQKLLDETSYALEYMSRSIRMAKKDDVSGVNCLTGDKTNYEITARGGLRFVNYKNECQEFFSKNNQLKEEKAGSTLPMTSTNTKIEALRFSLIGQNQPPTDNLQPRVTIFLDIKGAGQKPEEKPQIKIQTTISQRNLDIQY